MSPQQIDHTGLLPDGAPSKIPFRQPSAGSFINRLRNMVSPNRATTNDRLFSKQTRPLPSKAGAESFDQSQAGSTLPTRSRADELFSIFWQTVFPLYPFVDKQDTSQRYSSLWTGQRKYDPTFHCLLNVIFVLGCQLNPIGNLSDREGNSRIYFCQARQLLDQWTIETFQSIQIHLLLSLYFQSTNEPNESINAVAVAIRTAETLGLNLPVVSERTATVRKREMCRKVWHGCVLMDRITSAMLGRPPIISPTLASAVPRPLSVDEECLIDNERAQLRSLQRPSVMEFFNRTLDLYDIIYGLLTTPNFTSTGADTDDNNPIDRLLNCLRSNDSFSILNIERKLTNWEKTLPTHLKLGSVREGNAEQQLFSRQAVVIYQRFLHLRLMTLKPALSAHVFAETRQLDKSVAFGGMPLQVLSLQCAVVCVYVAQEAISLAYDRRSLPTNSIGNASEWWSNVLLIHSAATVLIAAKICPLIFAEISEQAIDRSWNSAISLLDSYREFHPTVSQVLTAINSLNGALPEHRQRLQGSDLASDLEHANNAIQAALTGRGSFPYEQSRCANEDSVDDIMDSQIGNSSTSLRFDFEEFNLDLDFTNGARK